LLLLLLLHLNAVSLLLLLLLHLQLLSSVGREKQITVRAAIVTTFNRGFRAAVPALESCETRDHSELP